VPAEGDYGDQGPREACLNIRRLPMAHGKDPLIAETPFAADMSFKQLSLENELSLNAIYCTCNGFGDS
jgi:hypothetical protein